MGIGAAKFLTLLSGGVSFSAADYADRLINTYSASEVWLLDDPDTTARASNVSARDGAHTSVNVQSARGPGVLAEALFAGYDGANDYTDIFTTNGSTGLADIFDGQEGWLFLAIKVASSSVWTDSTVRTLFYLRADGSNQILIDKSSTDNTLRFRYFAGVMTEVINAGSQTSTGWLTVAFRWNLAGATVTALVNGASAGTSGPLGTFAGALTKGWIGAASGTPTAVWSGDLAIAAVRFGNAGSDADIANLHNDLMNGW